ncbi:MAG: Crp/Fnr family transcriptional regulator [Desulfobacterota bacterium]|nr:Crp/Fnr family transcriptional regulator [Thermodesulfobacteriota bacterium]MDW8001750.1 Crp/Fnr family transcriptional regulator [Deltaproteobacteria bacterium]
MEDYLKKVPIFSSLRETELKEITKVVKRKRSGKGEIVCQEGTAGDSMYVVLSGKVKVSLFHEGKEYILSIIEKGGFFGELSLIDGLPRSASVETLEDSEFLVLKRDEFLRLLKTYPEISIEIMKTMATRLRNTDEKLKNLAFFPVENRILNYLIELAKKEGIRIKNYVILKKRPSNTEIANFCNCARETVSRAIKALKEKGIIMENNRQCIIFPPEDLA